MIRGKLFFTALLLLFTSLTVNAQVTDIIKPLRLTSGINDTIVVQDLFFSESYNITLSEANNLNAEWLPDSGFVVLIPDSAFHGFTYLKIINNNEELYIPVIVNREQKTSFEYKPYKNFEELTLFGSFNGWNRHQYSLTDEDNDGIYTTSITIEPGNYEYKFYGDGEEIVDPSNPDSVSNGMGSYNSVLEVKSVDTVKSFLHTTGYKKSDSGIEIKYYYENSEKEKISAENVFAFINNSLVPKENITVSGNSVTLNIPENNLSGKKEIRTVIDSKGIISNISTTILFDGKPAGSDNNFTWYDGIIYSLMIDRFNDGDTTINNPVQFDSLSWKANYMGGDLQGVINKLEEGYFDSLGINVIWISPVNDNPNEAYREFPEPHRYYSGYHGYWPISSNRVEEKFGNMNKLKELVSVAKNHNIKILLDFVSNHVHKDHPYFKENRDRFGTLDLPDGRKNIRFFDEFRLTTWFEPYLPSFDYLASRAAVDTMTDNAVWWLKTTGAAGFRHDAVKHVPNIFWRELTRKLKSGIESKTGNEVYQIGETFGSYDLINSYVNNGQLSAQFNFNLYDRATKTFLDSSAPFTELDKEMKKSFEVYGALNLMGNIMDSHDKNRFMAHADGDLSLEQWSAAEEGWNNPPKVDHPVSYKKAALYYAWMNSIPGLPVIYYGSEFGMTGASDPDNRRMMRFDSSLNTYEKEMLAETETIVNLRKNNPALRYGDFYTLQADENIYAYVRSDLNQRVLVVLNKTNKPQRAELFFPACYNTTKLTDLVTGAVLVPERENINIVIGAYSWSMYLFEK